MSDVFSPGHLIEGVSGLVRKSKHYGQVRVVVLDEETLSSASLLDVKLIHEKLELPVIYLRRGEGFDPRYMMMWRDRVVEPFGLTEGTVGRILDLIFGESGDLLKVAQLIAGNLDFVHNV